MHVKKGDKVIILTGKDRSETGEILAVDIKKERVKVARRNMIIKHQRPNPITGAEGARVEKENWIHVSNVALYSEKSKGAVRTSARWEGKDRQLFESAHAAEASFGGQAPQRIKKVRFAKKTGEVFA